MPKLPPGQITDIDPDEVSLVDKAANKRRFILLKAITPEEEEKNMDARVLKIVNQLGIEVPEVQEALVKALTPLLPLIPEDDRLLKAAEIIVGREEKAKDKDKDEDEDEVGAKLKKLDDRIATLQKAVNESKTGAPADTETITLLKAMRSDLAEAKGREDELRKSLTNEVEIRKAREYQEEAKGFRGLPVATPDLAGMLRTIDDSVGDADVRKNLRDLLKKSAATIASSALLATLGGAGRERHGTVQAEVQAAAQQIAKEEKVSLVKALDLALDRNPDLQQKYLAEVRGLS